MLWHISEGLLSPPPAGRRGEFFSDSYSGNLVKFLELNLTMWDTSRSFNSQTSTHWTSRKSSVMFQIVLPQLWLLCRCLWMSRDSSPLPIHLSHLGTVVCPVLSSVIDLRKIRCLICSGFYLMLEWSGDFQAPFMRNWKWKALWISLSLSCVEFNEHLGCIDHYFCQIGDILFFISSNIFPHFFFLTLEGCCFIYLSLSIVSIGLWGSIIFSSYF